MTKYFLIIFMGLVCVSYSYAESPLQIINVQSGIVSSTRQLLTIDDYTVLQFSSNSGSVAIATDDAFSSGLTFLADINAQKKTVLEFNPEVFLYEKSKIEFVMFTDSSRLIKCDVQLDFLDGTSYILPHVFTLSTVPTSVEIQLKGLPYPVDEIEKVQWRMSSDDGGQLGYVTISLMDMACFTDTSKALRLNELTPAEDLSVVYNISSTTTDSVAPSISSLKFNEKTILDGDLVSSRPEIAATVTDGESGVASWEVRVYDNDDDSFVSSSTTQNVSPTMDEVALKYEFDDELSGGDYYLRVIASDDAGNTTELESPYFTVTSETQFTSVMFGPVPFNPNQGDGKFNYSLSREAEVEISIYSINGEEVWHHKLDDGVLDGGSIGFNEVTWNGRDLYGQIVANGPYIAYLIARFDGDEDVKKIKIMVLK